MRYICVFSSFQLRTVQPDIVLVSIVTLKYHWGSFLGNIIFSNNMQELFTVSFNLASNQIPCMFSTLNHCQEGYFLYACQSSKTGRLQRWTSESFFVLVVYW